MADAPRWSATGWRGDAFILATLAGLPVRWDAEHGTAVTPGWLRALALSMFYLSTGANLWSDGWERAWDPAGVPRVAACVARHGADTLAAVFALGGVAGMREFVKAGGGV